MTILWWCKEREASVIKPMLILVQLQTLLGGFKTQEHTFVFCVHLPHGDLAMISTRIYKSSSNLPNFHNPYEPP